MSPLFSLVGFFTLLGGIVYVGIRTGKTKYRGEVEGYKQMAREKLKSKNGADQS